MEGLISSRLRICNANASVGLCVALLAILLSHGGMLLNKIAVPSCLVAESGPSLSLSSQLPVLVLHLMLHWTDP